MVAVAEQLGGAFGETGLLVLPCVAAHLNQVVHLWDFFFLHFLLYIDLTKTEKCCIDHCGLFSCQFLASGGSSIQTCQGSLSNGKADHDCFTQAKPILFANTSSMWCCRYKLSANLMIASILRGYIFARIGANSFCLISFLIKRKKILYLQGASCTFVLEKKKKACTLSNRNAEMRFPSVLISESQIHQPNCRSSAHIFY